MGQLQIFFSDYWKRIVGIRVSVTFSWVGIALMDTEGVHSPEKPNWEKVGVNRTVCSIPRKGASWKLKKTLEVEV